MKRLIAVTSSVQRSEEEHKEIKKETHDYIGVIVPDALRNDFINFVLGEV
mgnify:CR=1 FL=1